MSSLRLTVIIAIWFAGMLGLMAQPGDSTAFAPIFGEDMQRGEIRSDITTHYLDWDGRALGMLEAGVAVGLTNSLSAGASLRDTGGHGRTLTRYTADGAQVWGAWQLLHANAKHPGLALRVERMGESSQLSSTSATSSLTANPTYASSGVELRADTRRWRKNITVSAGVSTSMLNNEYEATVESFGGQMDIPLGKRCYLQPALFGYCDNYEGRHLTCDARLALHTAVTRRLNFSLAADLFPRGIPMADTPFSAASTVGVIYGSSASAQLHTRAVGYLSLAGEYRF